jgi:hypothetical protein
VVTISTLDVDQFYGIEFEEFPARIAEVAMWMMDHIMNNRLSVEFGQTFIRIPLRKSPHIRHADALELDWNSLLPAHQCSYVLGNPPFIGAKFQSEVQRQQVRHIAKLGGSGGTLDYVCAWFLKAGAYMRGGRAKIAFVSTNSITQGEQVAQLWPLLFDHCKLEIAFAHRTFAWGSEARGVAHVHVVIIGLTRADMEPAEKRLFSYENIKGEPVESRHAALTPYLFDAGSVQNKHLVVKEESQPINGLPKLIIGSKPIDGGYLIYDDEERAALLEQYPDVVGWLHPYVGADEYLNGGSRWILALAGVAPERIRAVPPIAERLKLVRRYRLGEIPQKRKQSEQPKTPGISSIALAETPTKYHVTVIPLAPFLVVPEVSSERRTYVPIGWLEPPTIPSNKLKIAQDISEAAFAVLTSKMHMAWLSHVGGRLKSDFQYSSGVVYNTFPWPHMSPADEARIGALAQGALDARSSWPGSTLADLYDPDLMPANLRKAHTALDLAVDRLYRKAPFTSERERVEHLFGLYEKMVAPIEAAAKGKAAKRRAKADG